MRKTIRKLFFIWDFDKEEKWLNEMAAKGLALVGTGFCKYEFEDCVPGEYRVCLQLLEKSPRNPEMQKYLAFLEQTGAEHVGSFTRWVYFRKKTADGDFELHGDNATRIKHLGGIIRLLKPLMAVNVGCGMYNLCIGIGLNSVVNVVCAGFSAALAVLLYRGLVKLDEKKKRLEKDAQLFE
jgi:hypothetical protein